MSTDPKNTADLPPKDQKREDSKGTPSIPPKEADAVKGGALPKTPGSIGGHNHNQTLRVRRASHL